MRNRGGNVPMIIETIVLETNQNNARISYDVSPALPAAMGMGGGYVPMIVVYERRETENSAHPE